MKWVIVTRFPSNSILRKGKDSINKLIIQNAHFDPQKRSRAETKLELLLDGKARPLDIRIVSQPRRMMKIFLFDGRRLRPRVSPFYAGVLSTSGLNELYVTINKNDYVVLLNGRSIAQISNRNLGKSMAHRNKFNRIVKARATSTLPIKYAN